MWNKFSFNEPFLGKTVSVINDVVLPDDYINFMKKHNGCDGDTGAITVILYKIEELNEINEDLQIEDFLPGNCIIGTNGGGEFFGIDTDGNYFTIPSVMDEDDKVKLGKTLDECIVNLHNYFA